MKTYQLDENYIFAYENSNTEGKPHLSVVVPPPSDIPEGNLARWVSDVDPIADISFGEAGSGNWEVLSDNRGKRLYSIETGEEVTDGSYDGIGDLPVGTTLEKPQTPEMQWDGKSWTLSKEAKERIAQKELEQVRAQKLSEINGEAQAFINKAARLDKVPDFEVATWVMQAAEAKAWAEDKAAMTPTLDRIAASRGVSRTALIEKALQKAVTYEALITSIAGQRQAYEDILKAAVDREVIEAIRPVYHITAGA